MSRRYALATISLDQMAGGLERNIVFLANALSRQGHMVSLVTFDRPGARAFYPIDANVRWYQVGKTRPHAPVSFTTRLRMIRTIRTAIKDAGASVLVCFHHGILVRFVLATLFMGIRIVASERNSLTLYDHIRLSKWNPNLLLLFLVDRITVQFPRYVDDYPRLIRSRIAVIPNPVHPAPRAPSCNDERAMPFQLLTVGRLCAQKNYLKLITVFAHLAPLHPDWTLVIVGSGELRERLLDAIKHHGLEVRIRLIPATAEISDVYRCASLFCMPSRWEGFPNALAEAMAHGLPAVGYRGCAGVRDLIRHGETGLLADGNGDVDSLSAALDALMSDPARRESMGKAAAEFVKQFHPDRVFSRWDALLAQVENPMRD